VTFGFGRSLQRVAYLHCFFPLLSDNATLTGEFNDIDKSFTSPTVIVPKNLGQTFSMLDSLDVVIVETVASRDCCYTKEGVQKNFHRGISTIVVISRRRSTKRSRRGGFDAFASPSIS
jgi:hypothetical protein